MEDFSNVAEGCFFGNSNVDDFITFNESKNVVADHDRTDSQTYRQYDDNGQVDRCLERSRNEGVERGSTGDLADLYLFV